MLFGVVHRPPADVLDEDLLETGLGNLAAGHPITAVQFEWSLLWREAETDVVPAARRLGVGLVPYSPLGRGFLTGQITSPDDLAADDFRRLQPRFQGENFAKNLAVVDQLKQIATERGQHPFDTFLDLVVEMLMDRRADCGCHGTLLARLSPARPAGRAACSCRR